MRSGIERLAYALTVILTGTAVGWLVATGVRLYPDDFAPLGLGPCRSPHFGPSSRSWASTASR